jgi:hypothetical protein
MKRRTYAYGNKNGSDANKSCIEECPAAIQAQRSNFDPAATIP